MKIRFSFSMLREVYRDSISPHLAFTSLCFVLIGAAVSLLPDRSLPVSSARHIQRSSEKQMKANEAGSPLKPIVSKDGLWQRMDEGVAINGEGAVERAARGYGRFSLDREAQAKMLRLAPMEFTRAAKDIQVVIALPMPDGTFTRFRVEESPVMAHELAARFPQIKSYKGKGIDDPTATARFDSTPAGFHAMVLSARGTFIIAPESEANRDIYLSYDRRSVQAENDSLVCSVSEAASTSRVMTDKQLRLTNSTSAADSIGGTLRTYRLAVAVTAEYTQTYGGGTVDGALAAVTTTINLVNAIYERDLAIRLILVADEPNIIFTNTATDGYTSDAVDTMYNQNQAILDSRIGAGNYDIGHVFDGHTGVSSGHFFFQGRGELASVCVNGLKGKGVSIFRSLEPSAVNAVYVVAHEMGHQFGASHTFNGTTNSDCLNGRIASTAFEPGTGSTIMAYRGSSGTNFGYFNICGAEDLQSTDLYFHIASISQIVNYTTSGNGASCAGLIATGNNAPTVDAGLDYTIPRGTPFTLTATGSDPDGDSLTYCWEEVDLGAPSPPSTDDGSRPIFRSFAPQATPARTFPKLSDILSNTSTFGESLPVTTRTMNFRVTLRDNHSGGGGGSTDAMLVNVTSASGPFVVTQPTSTTRWTAGSTQVVTWNVANTSNAPVSCANVRILLSIDGGLTFPIVLDAGTPNDGEATITVPDTQTSTARVKVEAVGNIFFDISDGNFNIAAATSPTPTPTPAGTATLALSATTYTVNEGDTSGALSFMVIRTGDLSASATVDFATSDASGLIPCQTNGNGAASERCDYASAYGTLRFTAGDSAPKTIQVPIINDAYQEPAESFTITLRNPQAANLGALTATATIVDDDAQAAALNPINDTAFFIKQQYIDFLGRVAEPDGFNFWFGRMTDPAKCPGQTQPCDRIDTALRFFESDEFRERGFYVYKLYDAVLGRFPFYASEFVPEVARLNGPQTPIEQRLGKDAYLLDFMSKTEFKTLYEQYLTADHLHARDASSAATFIDALCNEAGVTPASKAQLVANLQNSTRDPAHTIEDFILTPEINGDGTKFYDRARIVMQYFGFLRRDPDTSGFNFWWLRVATVGSPQYHDYRELVNNFLRADEYNFRFAFIAAP